MGRSTRAYYVADRIDPHPRKGPARPHKRQKGTPVEVPEDSAPDVDVQDLQEDVEDETIGVEEEMEVDEQLDAGDVEEAGEGEEEEDGEEEDGAEEAEEGEMEVFTTGKSLYDIETVKKPAGSVLRSAKVAFSPHLTFQEIYAAPSRDELEALKEADYLFKSNLFRLQMAEFLKEVKCNPAQAFLESALKKIKEIFEKIPNDKIEKEVS
jgi:hypothetical protein